MDTLNNDQTLQHPGENWSKPELYLISVKDITLGSQSYTSDTGFDGS